VKVRIVWKKRMGSSVGDLAFGGAFLEVLERGCSKDSGTSVPDPASELRKKFRSPVR